MSATFNYEILVIDDDPSIIKSFKLAFKSDNVVVRTTQNAEIGYEIVRSNPRRYAAIFIDLHIGEDLGTDVAQKIRDIEPHVSIYMMSGDYSESAVNAYILAKVDGWYKKPLDFFNRIIPETDLAFNKYDEFLRLVSDRPEIDTEIARKTGLVGVSNSIQEVGREILRLAPENINVLILGENGTGKEVVAKALHDNSTKARAARKFVAVNCGAIPETMIERELFGHVRGAFTGANQNSIGYAEAAAGGTLFLDEIGELPVNLQVKILRLIEEGTFKRIGDTEERKLTARIIAGTNVDLVDAIEKNNFREDLFYRLNGVSITLLPLRDRPEDIEPLFLHFKDSFEKKSGVKVELMNSVIERLQNHSWSGNVRELRNVVERLYLRAKTSDLVMKPEFLDGKFFKTKLTEKVSFMSNNQFVRTVDEITQEFEHEKRANVLNALRVSSGIQSEAGRIMGVRESTVRDYIKKYNLKEIVKSYKEDSIIKNSFSENEVQNV